MADLGDDGAWAVMTFLHGLRDRATTWSLRQRVSQTSWWNALSRSELGGPSLLELRMGDVPLTGHRPAGAALALRHIQIAQYHTVDPTTVPYAPPPGISTWLREP